MKKTLTLFLSIFLIVVFLFNFASCGENKKEQKNTPVEENNLPTLSYYITDNEVASNTGKIYLDLDSIICEDNITFNKNIAKMSLLSICENTRGDSFYLVDKNGSPLIGENTYSIYGLQNDVTQTMTYSDYTEDTNDLANVRIGNKIIEKHQTTYQLFFITILPYIDNSLTGWESNFDIGADTTSYYDLTGNHPDWQNKINHKGFDVTANRLYEKIQNYITLYSQNDTTPFYFVTGHSRGGALSNLIGKKLTDNGLKTIAYCFNSPTTTTENIDTTSSYKNIINILNEEDLVSSIPPSTCSGFKRYGIDYSYKLSDNAQSWSSFFKTEYKYFNSTDIVQLVSAFSTLCTTNRNGLYEYDTREQITSKQKKFFQKESDGDALIASFYSAFNENGLARKSVKITKEKIGTSCFVKFSTTPIFPLFFIEEMLGEMDILNLGNLDYMDIINSPYINFLSGYTDTIIPAVTKVLTNTNGVVHPHLEKTGLVGIDYVK